MPREAERRPPVFRYFENLVDPYVTYEETDRPPTRLWPFMRVYARPFHKVFALTAVMSIVVAAVEIWLIGYLGRLVDTLSETTPSEVWQIHGTELLVVALLILFVRPALQALRRPASEQHDPAELRHADPLARAPPCAAPVRSAGSRSDFAGRIANRIMQTPPAAGEAVFQVFDVIAFAVAYLIGAAILLFEADPRLMLPLLVWVVLYRPLVRWTMPPRRPGVTGRLAMRAAPSRGGWWTAYTNIHSVKMFAHHDARAELCQGGDRDIARTTFQTEMRIFTMMDVALVTSERAADRRRRGLGHLALGARVRRAIGVVAAAVGAGPAAQRHDRLDHVGAVDRSSGTSASMAEGMETIAQPITLVDKPGARPLRSERRADRDARTCRTTTGADPAGSESISLTIRAGRKGRPGGPLGRGQVDAGQAAPAVLRHRWRAHPDRRPGHLGRDAGQPAAPDRHGPAGQLAPAPLGARQHPLRPPRGDRGRDDRGREAGRGA